MPRRICPVNRSLPHVAAIAVRVAGFLRDKAVQLTPP